MPVQPAAISGQEDGAFGSFANSQVERPGGARRQRDSDHLAALAGDHHSAVAALNTERFYVRTGGQAAG